jgi:DNA-binding transcriptional MerR regulator
VTEPARSGSLRSIGEVIAALRSDFPDVSMSKIRFLEAEGLIEPQRTTSGYRKFSSEDLERLRYILGVQRDQYLPLKVIREHLEAIDRGLEPPQAVGGPQVPQSVTAGAAMPDARAFAPARKEMRLSRGEVLEATGLDDDQLSKLEQFGLVTKVAGARHYDASAVVIGKVVAELASFGLEPRHLRSFKAAADREAGLVEQVVTPMLRQRGGDGRARAAETVREMAALSVRLHAALLKSSLDRDLLQ